MASQRKQATLLGLRHLTLMVIAFLMLVPFYWVIKTAITNENIYAYPPSLLPRNPHLFNFVDVWYLIPFPRYLLNSIIVSAIAVIGVTPMPPAKKMDSGAASSSGKLLRGAPTASVWPQRSCSWIQREPPRLAASRFTATQ